MKTTRILAALVAVFLGMSAPLLAHAEARTYAVMSLVGDKLAITNYEPSVGSHLDTNKKKILDIGDTLFDEAAVRAANKVLKTADASASTTMMLTRDTGLYKSQNDMFDAPEANKADREYLLNLLKNRNVTHLLLITKMRTDADLKMDHEKAGDGKLEGLGFYIDNNVDVTSMSSLRSTKGVMAPYAYTKIRLIDAKTLQVLREQRAIAGHVVDTAAMGPNAATAFNDMTSKQKIDFIEQMLNSAMEGAVPLLLK